MAKTSSIVSAIILGAGRSQRMGQPKLLMSWGNSTIIENIVKTLQDTGINSITVVLGDSRIDIENVLHKWNVSTVLNPDYENGNMVTSLQAGLKCLHSETEIVLVVLGDQPGIDSNVVTSLIKRYKESRAKIIVPSYNNRKGHPWLFHISLKDNLLNLPFNRTMRDFLMEQNELIEYLLVDTPSILIDIDTPEDYFRGKPKGSKPH